MDCWRRCIATVIARVLGLAAGGAGAQVVDIPTRPGVTQRLLLIKPAQAQAAVVLMAGGHGGLRICSQYWCDALGDTLSIPHANAICRPGSGRGRADVPSDRQRRPSWTVFARRRRNTPPT